MELSKLEVKNWRGVPQASITFGRGITIIGGPNECGKTSLRSALHAALVLPTGARGEQKMIENTYRPWETKLFPTVKLQFSHEGKSIDVEKEFLRKKDWSSLRVDGRLIAQDGEVQRQLDEILGDSLDWIEILWGKQGDVSFDRSAPDSIKGRLAKAAQDTVIPQVAQLKDSIDDEYQKYWTPKEGGPNKRFQEIRNDVMKKENKVRELEAVIKAADIRATQLEQQSAELAIEKAKLAQLETDWTNGQKSLGAWQTYERTQIELKVAETSVATLEQWISTWRTSLKRVGDLLPECRDWLVEVDKLRQAAGTEPNSAELDSLRAKLSYLELAITKQKREELEKILVPSAAELKELENTEESLRKIEASLDAVAFRAELKAERTLQMEIVRDGGEKELRSLTAEELSEWQAQQRFDLSLPGVATLRVESGDPAIAEKVEERAMLRKNFDAALAKWQVPSLMELRTKAAEKDLHLKQVASVDSKQLAERRINVSDADELDRLSLEGKEQTIQTLSSEFQIAEANFKATQSQYLQSMKAYQDLLGKGKLAELKAVLTNLHAHCSGAPLDSIKALTIPNSIEKANDDKKISSSPLDESACKVLSDLLLNAQAYETEFAKLVSEKRGLLEKQKAAMIKPEGDPITTESLAQKEKQKAELTVKVNGLETSINQSLGAITAQGNLHAQFVEAEEDLARAQAEVARVESEAHAIKELRIAFDAAREKLQEDVVAPLQTRVTEALDKLTGGFYRGVAFDPSLKVSGVHANTATSIVLDEISFGTREQLSFLTRLCLAELLAGEAACQVVVLDDNLVHTDSMRMLTACQLLETASEHVQIVVFTCHPERYASIASATRVELASREAQLVG